MESKAAVNLIKTRFLILSDTHGMAFTPENHPLQLENRTRHVDVAIHCGDLTEESKIAEFITTLELLKSLDAKLKLVIAGNHDFTLDVPIFKKKVAEAIPALQADEVNREYGDYGEIRTLFEDARQSGIMFLDEGTHHFTLDNGASLTVYASPYTPSQGEGGFQYPPQEGHTFAIEPNTDVAITHGPPRGVLDFTDAHQRAGCKDLFAAVARNRPSLHCFGHIHEGWGAKLVAWREPNSAEPSHFTAVDNGKSQVVETLGRLKASRADGELPQQQRSYHTSHCRGDTYPLKRGQQTLFVNAAIQGEDEASMQLPWLVDLDLLPSADVSSRKRKQAPPGIEDGESVGTRDKRMRMASPNEE